MLKSVRTLPIKAVISLWLASAWSECTVRKAGSPDVRNTATTIVATEPEVLKLRNHMSRISLKSESTETALLVWKEYKCNGFGMHY